ncbi:MAG: efflux RND transporter periplasmic adaptor subunit [Cyanobacteria bacterium REEB459]|nr:efflux RND transporter periplasmic adaptor subunit [Cyanobacteria bacterium REEB459]
MLQVRKTPGLKVIVLVSAVLLGGGLWAWQNWRSEQQREQQAKVAAQTTAAVRQDLTVKISASGTIQPIAPVNVSPKQPGRLIALYVEQGDRVTTGQDLARMDASNLQGPLLQAQAGLKQAQANLRKLQAGSRPQDIAQAEQALREAQAQMVALTSLYTSNQALYNSGALSQADRDRSRSDYEAARARIKRLTQALDLLKAGSRPEDIAVAEAQVMQAQGSLKTVQTQLNDTLIKAPFAGTITQKYADVGAFVTPTTSASATSSATSSSIVALASDLEAVVNVAETDVGSIQVGQTVELQVDAYPNHPFQGRVRRVAPESIVVQNVTSFQIRVQVLNDSKHQLKSGMNLTASFLVSQTPQALLIPTMAIVNRAEGVGVYVSRGAGKPEFRPIQLGATVDGQTEVIKGLAAGERVFTTLPGQREPNKKPVKPSTFSPPTVRPPR